MVLRRLITLPVESVFYRLTLANARLFYPDQRSTIFLVNGRNLARKAL